MRRGFAGALMILMLSGCMGTTKPVIVRGYPFQPHAGVLIPSDLASLPPIAESGIRRIGVISREDRILTINHARVTFGGLFEQHDWSDCVPAQRLAPAFVARIDALAQHSAIDISHEVGGLDAATQNNFWYGTVELTDTPAGRALRETLREKHGLDAVLIISESVGDASKVPYELGNGASIGDPKASLIEGRGSKGIATNRKVKNYAFASIDVQLIDLNTGKQTKHGAYRQSTLWRMGEINWSIPWAAQPRPVIEDVCDRLKVLDENNVTYALWRLRIAPSDSPPPPPID